jgi:glycosyltransferase involved in cell wall biosynthesis
MARLLIVTTVVDTVRGFMLPFGTHFRSRGWRVDAMARGVTGCPACQKAFDNVWEVDWSRSPLDGRNLVAAPKRLREVVAREAYDLVHVHTPVAAFVTRWALRGLRKRTRLRVLYTAHGFHFYRGAPFFKAFLFRALEKLAGRWTDFLVVINPEDYQAALRLHLVPPDRLKFIPGIGVDWQALSRLSIPDEETRRLRDELKIGSKGRLFLMVAEFTPGKRHVDALRALASLKRPDVFMAFAGNGPLMEKTRRLAVRLGVSERTRFLGFRNDVTNLMSVSDALVLPSLREGLPRSILEAQSMALSVIGSSIRGIRELLGDGMGLLVPAKDPDSLSRMMSWVLDHPDEARQMALAAQRRAAVYSIESILSAHEALYAEALATLDTEGRGVGQAKALRQGLG